MNMWTLVIILVTLILGYLIRWKQKSIFKFIIKISKFSLFTVVAFILIMITIAAFIIAQIFFIIGAMIVFIVEVVKNCLNKVAFWLEKEETVKLESFGEDLFASNINLTNLWKDGVFTGSSRWNRRQT